MFGEKLTKSLLRNTRARAENKGVSLVIDEATAEARFAKRHERGLQTERRRQIEQTSGWTSRYRSTKRLR